ncbi:hypothetical protein O181_085967 [Austropuccinia psidii MF-1]|uniref:Uncharacterized protein n=1 Tax=Austropuccinia psidii MF-1 TaxID=1389203 RepID=A0A9Q3IM40_9BASI|nr:hypothetical protein [Austropuccinia psidii MF-1]
MCESSACIFSATSCKLTELTEYLPSALPPSVLCGSCVLSLLASPSMASSGHFNPYQTYDGYKEIEVLDPACTECLAKEVPISRTNTEGLVKRIRRISYSPRDPDSEGSDELDVEEVEVVSHLVGHQSSSSSSQPLANRFQIHVIPITPRTFRPTLATVPTSLPPSSSHARPALTQAVRPSPIQQPRNSPIISSHQLQPTASSSRRRDGFFP